MLIGQDWTEVSDRGLKEEYELKNEEEFCLSLSKWVSKLIVPDNVPISNIT